MIPVNYFTKKKPFLWSIFLIVLMISCTNDDDLGRKLNPKLLIIGIDGCRPDALVTANTPFLDSLSANGTLLLNSKNTGLSYSGPGWSGLLTGVREDKHGVLDNSFINSNFTEYPHIFKRVKDNYPNGRTVSVCQWHPINNKIASGYVDSLINTENSTNDVQIRTNKELEVENLTSLFVHFDDVDAAGHKYGFDPNNINYTEAIENTDLAIGSILEKVKSRNNYSNENWAVIITTDHGGIGKRHGGFSDEERDIFIILSGGNLSSVRETAINSNCPPRLVDIFPTVLNHLGITIEVEWGLDGESLLTKNCEE